MTLFKRKSILGGNRRVERGFVTAEFLGGAALLLFPMTMLVILLPTYFERSEMIHNAAREAARECVLSPDATTGIANANAAVAQVEANYSLPDRTMRITKIKCDPEDRSMDDSRPKDEDRTVTVTVHTEMPTLTIPGLNITIPPIPLNASHSEKVDYYRSLP